MNFIYLNLNVLQLKEKQLPLSCVLEESPTIFLGVIRGLTGCMPVNDLSEMTRSRRHSILS